MYPQQGPVDAPAVNGTAAIQIRLPRKTLGHKVYLRARAQASGYITELSSKRRVRIRP
jgi:hypothetical protein